MTPAEPSPAQPVDRDRPGGAWPVDDGLFQLAFHNSPAMQSVVRASDGVIVEVNDTFLQKLRRTREQVIGKTPMELNAWVEPGQILDYRNQLETKGRVLSYEVLLRASDGSILTVLVSSHRVEIAGVVHYLTAGVDITPRKEAEARLLERERQLRESEALFSTAFRSCPVLMTIARLEDGRFVEVNPAFLAHIGSRREEILGRDSQELGLWVDPVARSDFFQRLKQDRLIRDVECQIRTPRGTIHTMQISGEIIEINREPHLITFGLDITQTKAAEAELQHALAQERELHQLKGDFVSLVSHEFRTPLEIIMSSADNLQRYHDRLPAAKREQLLQTIQKSVRRMAGMMEEVLVLGRVESGRTEFKPGPFELPAYCQRIADEIQTATGRRCPVEVHAAGAPRNANGDENLLRHILTNLLSNAIKYSPEQQVVTLAVDRQGGDAVFRITDQGCGIPAADQARLFHAFHRGTNVRQIPGTGLGLVIVQRCVELHGGSVACESQEGRGTTFTVRLPLYRDPH